MSINNLKDNSLKGARIALTGATGFLGRHLLPLLLEAGATVSCLCRPSSNIASLPKEISIIRGDCAKAETLIPFLKNQDILIHAAASLFCWNWQDYLTGSAKSCQNIAKAYSGLAESERPGKIVFISSLAACGPCENFPGAAETAPPRPVSAYGWSKLLAENILKSEFGEKLIILRPPIIYGSGDKGLLPYFKCVQKGFAIAPGFRRAFPVSAIHVRDCARAIVLACSRPASGLYHLSGPKQYDMKIMACAMAKAMNRKNPAMLQIPLFLMGFCASVSSISGRFLNKIRKLLKLAPAKPFNWNEDKFLEAAAPGWLANAGKIEKELGFAPETSLEEGMKEAVEGYKKGGWL